MARLFGLNISDFSAWLLWCAVYVAKLSTTLRKLQVFLEWTVDVFFPQDVTCLHMQRTGAMPAMLPAQGTPGLPSADGHVEHRARK